MIGRTLGPYQILAELGRGGMGEVYRAKDTKLNRDVAIKVLPEVFTGDADRLARFKREAQVLASLNHPNIAAIYGIEDSGATHALVMELVEGEDLSAIITRGAMSLADALPIARQIADALEAAHEQGIVHRDLKPQNIKVRADGTVKVLDFGLAKAMDRTLDAGPGTQNDIANSPTLTVRGTQMGMIIGTAAYMAPEQARGRAVDRRADIWAFGVVLFEMLTGRRCFEGDDISITLASVLKDEVKFDALPADLPMPLRRLLRRCLEKDPRKRLSSIGDARLDMDDASSPSMEAVSSGLTAAASSAPRSSRTALLVAAAAVVALAVLAYSHFSEGAPEPPVMHVTLPLPDGGAGFLGISPDGRLVLAGANNLAVRDLAAGEWTPIESARGARAPFWSPDGRSIAFYADDTLKVVSATGGPARELCSQAGAGAGGAWGPNDVILFAGSAGTMRQVPATGGACTPVMKDDTQRVVWHPTFLPDGVHYLYVGQIKGDLASRGVYVGSLAELDAMPMSGKKLLDDNSNVIYTPPAERGGPSHLLFLRGSTIMAQAFNTEALTLTGDPFPVAKSAGYSLSTPQVAASVGGGTLVFGSNLKPAGYQLVWMDRAGKRVGTASPVGDFRSVALSSDGRFATARQLDEGLRLFDLAQSSNIRLSKEANPTPGVWAKDGRSVVFSATINGVRGIYRKPADGSGDEVLLQPTPGNQQMPTDLSATGTLVYVESDPKTKTDIWYWSKPGDPASTPERFLATPAAETQPQLSPDGRWLAYVSSDTGLTVRQFPSGPGFIRLGQGLEPRWKADGSELYFVTANSQGSDPQVVAVPMKGDGRGGLSAGTPTPLFGFRSLITIPQNNSWLYAPSPDGQRFLVSLQAESGPPMIHVLTNWLKAARGGR